MGRMETVSINHAYGAPFSSGTGGAIVFTTRDPGGYNVVVDTDHQIAGGYHSCNDRWNVDLKYLSAKLLDTNNKAYKGWLLHLGILTSPRHIHILKTGLNDGIGTAVEYYGSLPVVWGFAIVKFGLALIAVTDKLSIGAIYEVPT